MDERRLLYALLLDEYLFVVYNVIGLVFEIDIFIYIECDCVCVSVSEWVNGFAVLLFVSCVNWLPRSRIYMRSVCMCGVGLRKGWERGGGRMGVIVTQSYCCSDLRLLA